MRIRHGGYLAPRAWIFEHFSYDFSISDWYWEAGDVTHILSDITQYSTTSGVNAQDRDTGNELLYALKHAPMLSCKYTPDAAVEMITSDSKGYDTLAVMAANSENTKYGRKVRATFSGDDITREMTYTSLASVAVCGMAKVYDVPRYANQTRHKMICFLSLAADLLEVDCEEMLKTIKRDDTEWMMEASSAKLLGMLEVEFDLLNEPILEEEIGEDIACLREAYDSGFRLQNQLT